MKKTRLFIVSLLTCMLFGCSETYIRTSYDDLEHRMPVKSQLELKFVQVLEFHLRGFCSEGRAVAFARHMKFADELGSITMRQIDERHISHSLDFSADSAVYANEAGVHCEYTALGFKVVKTDSE